MANDNWTLAMELVGQSPRIAEKLLSSGSKDLLNDLYSRAEQTASFGAKLTYTLLDTAPALIERLGSVGAEPIWQCTFAMAAGNPENAVALLMKSPEIVDNLISHLHSRQIIRPAG